MKPAIEIRNLGKEYTISAAQRYLTLRDKFTSSVKNLFTTNNSNKEKFWALQDINLDILPGERVGIIGSNGAGKSTLLKIISRITPPTTGEALIRGRVGSLLEVGTGFHPELSGRENIYLNGSILGLSKKEITKQLDAIIDFSGVEKFIDTPLKHFSSGMQLRLAFAVAAHLEPEILLIDEVLAVGDAAFQKKCIGKMEEVSKEHGRTILFVSHNLDSLRKFCETTILLNEGRLIKVGKTEQVINEYLKNHLSSKAESSWPDGLTSYDKKIRLRKVWLHDNNSQLNGRFKTSATIGISADYEVIDTDVFFTHGINVFNQENINVFNSHDTVKSSQNIKTSKGVYTTTVWIPANLLPEGLFSIDFAFFLPNPVDIFLHEKNIVSFELYTDFNEPSSRGNYAEDFPGIIRPLLKWETIKK